MKKVTIVSALISLLFLFIFSCKKEDSGEHVNFGSSGIRTTVTGIVLDESNAPLNGVTITAYGQTATTGVHGTFVLKNISVNKTRCVLKFSKSGFFNRSHGFIASANTVNYVHVVLISNAAVQTVPASAGGTVNLADGSSVQFSPNSFINSNGSAYSGTVNIAIKHLSPGDADFGFMIPGNDLLGKNMNNEDVALYTYGMIGVELTGSSGELLNLAQGTTATLTASISPAQLGTAPASIPLWYFDETTSLWKEEGSASKIGNNYVGTVSHFSWWNCDIGTYSPYIKGKVIDCDGIPVPNCVVTVNGWATTLTNQNGEWQGQVPSGEPLTAQVLAGNNGGTVSNSQLENIPALSENQTYVVPDLAVNCISKIIGTIKTCSGEATDGFVSISNGTFYNFQFTENGIFNLLSQPNASLELYAASSNFNYYHSQNITSLSYPDNLTLGNVLLCDSLTMNQVNNNFTLNGGTFVNQLFNLAVTNSTAYLSDSGFISIYMAGTANGYTISNYRINVYDTIPMATYCSVTMSLWDGIQYYAVATTNLSCSLAQVGSLGNKIKGSYFGSVTLNSNGITYPANISGAFDVIRSQ